jgi:glyoxylase I family protein
MAIKGIFYISAYASDFERSKRFYTETLGWKLGTDEPGIAGLSFGTGYLVLHADQYRKEPRLYAGGMHVEVQVDDVEAEHARLKSLGVAVGELHSRPWGERNFSFTDPDGYVWSYGQRTHGAAAG